MRSRRLQKYLVLVCILSGLVIMSRFDLSLNSDSLAHNLQMSGSRIIPDSQRNTTMIANKTAKSLGTHVSSILL